MNITISKWGNSIGIRIPQVISETLGFKAGDKVSYELKNGGMFIKKEKTTAQMFEEFYGKPFSEITLKDIGDTGEIEWGQDVGGEIL